MIDDIISALGIPKRVFEGSSPASSMFIQDYIDHEELRLDRLRSQMSKTIIQPMLEANFPEMFWEVMHICSPRGRVLRRKEPPTITWK